MYILRERKLLAGSLTISALLVLIGLSAYSIPAQRKLPAVLTVHLFAPTTVSLFLGAGSILFLLVAAIYAILRKETVHWNRLLDLERQASRDQREEAKRMAEVVAIQRHIVCARQNLEASLQIITERIQDITRADGCVVELLNGDELVYRAASGTAAPYVGLRRKAASGLSGRCIRENMFLNLDNARADDQSDRITCRNLGAGSIVVAPLWYDGRAIGVLKVLSERAEAFSDKDIDTLEMVGSVLSVAMSDAVGAEALQTSEMRLREQKAELETANARLEALATTDGLTGLNNHRAFQVRLSEEYDRALRHNTPLSVLMLDVDRFKQYNDSFGHPMGDVALRQVAQIMRDTARTCDVVGRYGGEEFVVLLPGAGVEDAKTAAERFRQRIGSAVWPERPITVSIGVGTLANPTVPLDAILTDADAALYRSKHRGRNCVTHATDPVEVEVLVAQATRWHDDLLQKLFAAQTQVLGASNDQVREQVQQAYNSTIVSWSGFLDTQEKEIEGHSERVTDMMVRLARHINMSEKDVQFARWGAWLHDIGKMATPDSILHKEGPLTEDEWVIMRQHTSVAYEMLKPIQFLGPAIAIPYCHHEKWDGTGYPRGLKADEIPRIARLFTVIDVYDALTTDRPYRSAWPEAKVREHLLEGAGTHFDPNAVDTFLSMLEQPFALQMAA